MDAFYCPALSPTESQVTLSPKESHHLIRVFRKQPGQCIRLTDGRGHLAAAEIVSSHARGVVCQIRDIRHFPRPEPRIHVGLATLRPNRMDWAVEKLTELGVAGIQTLRTRHTSVHAFKQQHLQKVAISALKQSGQAYLPDLKAPLDLSVWLREASAAADSIRLLAHPDAAAVSVAALERETGREIRIGIGPEGGFAPDEVQQAVAAGFQLIKLTDTILRAETAAVVAAAQLILSFR